MSKTIFIIGQSGAGKDTLAESLLEYLGGRDSVLYISTGDELRKFTRESGITAKLAKDNNEKGHIAPWFVIVGCWFQKLSTEFTGEETMLWNGTPRSVKEFEILSQMVEFYGRHADMIHLQVSDDECLRRIVERQRSIGREETKTEDAIKNKLQFYYDKVLPAIELAKGDKNFTVHEIDWVGSKEEVFERVKEALEI